MLPGTFRRSSRKAAPMRLFPFRATASRTFVLVVTRKVPIRLYLSCCNQLVPATDIQTHHDTMAFAQQITQRFRH